MARTVTLFALFSLLCNYAVAEWHCGADNAPFTTFISKTLVNMCSAGQRAEANDACQRHDSCYHRAKPANGGSERARNQCDMELCTSLFLVDGVPLSPCGTTLNSHCGVAFTLGWIAQIEWAEKVGMIQNVFEEIDDPVEKELKKVGNSIEDAWNTALDFLQG